MTPHGIVEFPQPRARVAPALIRRVAGHLAKDRLAILPTETRYALCAVGTSRAAIAKVRAAKGRAASQPLSVFTDSVQRLSEWRIRATHEARILMEAFWPGPLTLILPATSRIFRFLGAEHSVGVRFSPEQLIIRTVEHFGKPLVATSANRSGDEPDTRTENLWLTNLSKDGTVLWLRPRRYIRRPVSTVVDCTGRRIRILRAGAISNAAIMSALGGSLHSGKA